MRQAWALTLLVCWSSILLQWTPVVGRARAPPDARFRSATFLSEELPARNTGLMAALQMKLRDLSHGQPHLQIIPEMVTIGKMIEYGALTSVRSFARDKGSIYMSRGHSKDSNKWSKLSSCQDQSAWHCLFGHPHLHPAPANSTQQHSHPTPDNSTQHHLHFTHEDMLTALEVLQWKTEEHQIIFAGATIAALAPHIHHLPHAVERVHNVDSLRDINISLHGRFTDSCDYKSSEPRSYGAPIWNERGRACFTFETYMQQLDLMSSMYQTRNVLVATDSQEFLDFLLANKTYNYMYIKADRNPFKRVQNGQQGWIQDRQDLTSEAVDSSLSDMWLLQYGHVLLGGLGGHYSRAIYYLMAGQLGHAPRYKSLDGEAPIWHAWRGMDFVDAAVQGPDPWLAHWQWHR